ncbi:MAG: hypothetical protein ACQEV0_16035 [Bacillota bacterium]
MHETIKNESIVKLTSASLLIMAASEKVKNYMQKNAEIFEQIKEDEEAMQLFNLYYEENETELKEAALESLFTSNEAEKSLEESGDSWNEF